MQPILAQHAWPQIEEGSIASFIKLRNGKTHAGMIEWGDSAELYPALLALAYACLMKHSGLPDEKVKAVLGQLF